MSPDTPDETEQLKTAARAMLRQYALADLSFYCRLYREREPNKGLAGGMCDFTLQRDKLRQILNDLAD